MKPPRCMSPIADQWGPMGNDSDRTCISTCNRKDPPPPPITPVKRVGMERIERRDEADLLKLPGLPECVRN